MFEWTYLTSAISDQPRTVYKLDGVEVARLWQHAKTRAWWVTLDVHLSHDKRRNRECSGYDSGRAGVETWANRHAGRLETEVGRINSHRPKMPWLPG